MAEQEKTRDCIEPIRERRFDGGYERSDEAGQPASGIFQREPFFSDMNRNFSGKKCKKHVNFSLLLLTFFCQRCIFIFTVASVLLNRRRSLTDQGRK